MPKTWKTGGEEDKFIKKLIRSGKIHKYTKPTKLIHDHPDVFGGYSSNVVRNHLNSLKRANGLYRELLLVFNIVYRSSDLSFSSRW